MKLRLSFIFHGTRMEFTHGLRCRQFGVALGYLEIDIQLHKTFGTAYTPLLEGDDFNYGLTQPSALPAFVLPAGLSALPVFAAGFIAALAKWETDITILLCVALAASPSVSLIQTGDWHYVSSDGRRARTKSVSRYRPPMNLNMTEILPHFTRYFPSLA